jgi:hypothetical protein
LILFRDGAKGIEQAIDPSQAAASDIIKQITKQQKIAAEGFLIPPKSWFLHGLENLWV